MTNFFNYFFPAGLKHYAFITQFSKGKNVLSLGSTKNFCVVWMKINRSRPCTAQGLDFFSELCYWPSMSLQ